jgi:hypothetical protein
MQKRKRKTAGESAPGRSKRRIEVPSLAELVAETTSANRYGEIPTGPPRGKELLALVETLKPFQESFPEIEDPLPESLPEFD